jgi:hypothetical protein
MTEIKDSCLWKIWKTWDGTPFHAHSPVHRSFGQDMTQFKVKTSRWGTECDMMGLGGLPSYGHPQFLHVEFPKLMNFRIWNCKKHLTRLSFRSKWRRKLSKSEPATVCWMSKKHQTTAKFIKDGTQQHHILDSKPEISTAMLHVSWAAPGVKGGVMALVLASWMKPRGGFDPKWWWIGLFFMDQICSDGILSYFIIFYPCGLWIFVTRLVFFRTITLLSYPWFILLAVILDCD